MKHCAMPPEMVDYAIQAAQDSITNFNTKNSVHDGFMKLWVVGKAVKVNVIMLHECCLAIPHLTWMMILQSPVFCVLHRCHLQRGLPSARG